MPNKLAVSIPTFNRAVVLNENLHLMLPDLIKYKIPVYISDDSTNNETTLVIEELKKQYDGFHYTKNSPGLGHDSNCVASLSRPDADYIWYLGDSIIIAEGAIKKILDLIAMQDYDFIVVATEKRKSNVVTKHYTDSKDFFKDLAWHATLTGATIYRKENLFKMSYDKYINSNFMQLAILLEEFITSNNGLYWINENLIYPNVNKGASYWKAKIFKVFAQDWSNFILSLPDHYDLDSKHIVIQSHSYNTGIFSLKNFIKLRGQGVLNLANIKKYHDSLVLSSTTPLILLKLLSLIPVKLVAFLLRFMQPKVDRTQYISD